MLAVFGAHDKLLISCCNKNLPKHFFKILKLVDTITMLLARGVSIGPPRRAAPDGSPSGYLIFIWWLCRADPLTAARCTQLLHKICATAASEAVLEPRRLLWSCGAELQHLSQLPTWSDLCRVRPTQEIGICWSLLLLELWTCLKKSHPEKWDALSALYFHFCNVCDGERTGGKTEPLLHRFWSWPLGLVRAKIVQTAKRDMSHEVGE